MRLRAPVRIGTLIARAGGFSHEPQMSLVGLVQKWRGAASAPAPITSGDASVIRPMPRREMSHSIAGTHVTLPRARRVTFRPGVVRPIVRLYIWVWSLMRFYFGNLSDVITRRASVERRAV